MSDRSNTSTYSNNSIDYDNKSNTNEDCMSIDTNYTETSGSSKEKNIEEKNEGEEFEVEYIIDAKISNNGECKYLVKWKDYSHHYNSWEPSANFLRTDILDDFWNERRRTALEICRQREIQTKDFFEYCDKNVKL